MRRLLVITTVFVVVVVGLICSGCQKPKTAADPVLDAASEQVEHYNSGYAAAFVALRELNSRDRSPEQWQRTAELFANAEAWMPARRAALEAADVHWREVAEMDATEEQKRYASLMREVVAIKQGEEIVTAEILSVCREISEHYATGAAVQTVTDEKWRTLGELDTAATRISADVRAKQKGAVKLSDGRSRFRTWDE